MHKLDLNIARLKLLLAEVGAKMEAMGATRRQYQAQIDRLVDVAAHEDGPVDRTLAMMIDVDTRLDELGRQQHYLALIRTKAQRELDSLQLTKLIEETRTRLALLRQRANTVELDHDGSDAAQINAEIRRLEEIITVASGAAAKSISG